LSVCTDISTSADLVTCYSNSANFLDILAPSNNAYTTGVGGGYISGFGGTSAASPYSAGVGAILQNYAKSMTGSYFTSAELKARMVDNGDPVTDPKNNVTKPRVNAGNATQYQLITTESPLYGGSINPDCSIGCLYDDGTPVTLTATPNSGYTFAGWSGACSGTGTCQVTMDSDKTVTATFTGTLQSFSDDFNDGNDNGWTRKSGTWAVEGGEYSGTGASISAPAFSVINTETQDMTIDVDAKDLGTGTYQNFYIVFAYDEANRKAYWAGARVGGNMWSIEEIDIDTGAWSYLASTPETINTNTWYSLKVIVSGDTVTLYADGSEKVSYTFPGGMPVGKVGLGGHNNHVHFDDFSVNY